MTNNATKSRGNNKGKFDKMGIDCTEVSIRIDFIESCPLAFVLTIGTDAQEEIFTSAFASAAYLKNVLKFPEDKKVYVIGEKGIEDELDAVGIKRSGGTVSLLQAEGNCSFLRLTDAVSPRQSPEDNVFVDLMDFSSITSDPEVGAVLCGLDMHMNYKKYARAFKYLRENEGCLFMATNLDSTFPTHGTVHPGGFSLSLSR